MKTRRRKQIIERFSQPFELIFEDCPGNETFADCYRQFSSEAVPFLCSKNSSVTIFLGRTHLVGWSVDWLAGWLFFFSIPGWEFKRAPLRRRRKGVEGERRTKRNGQPSDLLFPVTSLSKRCFFLEGGGAMMVRRRRFPYRAGVATLDDGSTAATCPDAQRRPISREKMIKKKLAISFFLFLLRFPFCGAIARAPSRSPKKWGFPVNAICGEVANSMLVATIRVPTPRFLWRKTR